METTTKMHVESTSKVVIQNAEHALLESIASWSNWKEADDCYPDDDDD